MAEPMPRDSLGRIVYVGDMIDGFGWVLSAIGELVAVVNTPFGNAQFAVGNVTIDLAASPERTNYERYFADLGSWEDVLDAITYACDTLGCADCPIEDWPELFGSGEISCLAAFLRWLGEPAVL